MEFLTAFIFFAITYAVGWTAGYFYCKYRRKK
jgi:hypothetical protein